MSGQCPKSKWKHYWCSSYSFNYDFRQMIAYSRKNVAISAICYFANPDSWFFDMFWRFLQRQNDKVRKEPSLY